MSDAPAKPTEVEELVDEYFHRPIARRLVALLVHTPITPNQVTLISGVFGVSAGLVIPRAVLDLRWALVAGTLLFLAVIFDCADGQLARARGISSTTGAILDGVCDYAVGITVALGATWFLVARYGSPWYGVLGIAGLVSTAVQSAMFDHTKTHYIARVSGGYREREEDLGLVERRRAEAWCSGRYGDAFLFWIYAQYSRAQNAALLIRPAADPVAYRAANAGRMRLWTFLGIGTHLALAYLLMLLAWWWPEAMVVYNVVAVSVLNIALVWLMVLEARAARR